MFGGEYIANNKVKAKQTSRKPKYEQIISMNDDKINVLILGTSGCGKSTLMTSMSLRRSS